MNSQKLNHQIQIALRRKIGQCHVSKSAALVHRAILTSQGCTRTSSTPLWNYPSARSKLYQQQVAMFSSFEDLGRNPGLESVIEQGIQSLEATAADVEAGTRRKSLDIKNSRRKEDLTPRQRAESHRLMDVATQCLEDICIQETASRRRPVPGLTLAGEPIVILEVEVNRDVKLAKLYWTLPYGVLLDQRVNQNVFKKLVMSLQSQMEEGNSGKLLSKYVHNRLRHYYPPRIKLVPATDEMVRKALMEFMEN